MKTLIFDTETTGLIGNSVLKLENQPSVIEFYGHVIQVHGDKWERIDELEFMCDPGILITSEITNITNITNEMLKGKPAFSHYQKDICKLMKQADLVVAHNLAFDRGMMEIEARRLDIKWPWPKQAVCTVEATEYLNGYRLNLGLLYGTLFNKPFSGAHRAKQDVVGLTECWVELKMRGVV